MNNNLFIPNGWMRFEYYLQQLQLLLNKAETSQNPAWILYSENARTPLFMLEALSRIYEKIYNKKSLFKLKEHFKLLEDMLGAIDYYDVFYKQMKNDKKIPKYIIDFFHSKTAGNLKDLNEILIEKGWLGSDNKRMKKINIKLQKIKWLAEEEDTIAVKNIYTKSIKDIVEDIQTNKINFDNVEEDIHELRRELRWLSIYPQCFRGLFQLKSSKPTVIQKKYLRSEIINSSYNKMSANEGLKNVIYLNANNFYALSWMIARLGELKDAGLKIFALKEAFLSNNKIVEEYALQQAYRLCNKKQLTIPEILSIAKQESNQFFSEKLLDQLVL